MDTKSFIPMSTYDIRETDTHYIITLRGGKTTEIPKKIDFNSDTSWILGLWVGDNFGSRNGAKSTKAGIKSSGRFGIINNDMDIVNEFIRASNSVGITNIRIDISLPQGSDENCEDVINKFKAMGINKIKKYPGSDWRKNIGYAAYVNNTSILRIFNHIFLNVQKFDIEAEAFISGIIDSDGNIDKANKLVQITNKDEYIQTLIENSLKNMSIKFKTRKDKNGRINTLIREYENLNMLSDFLDLASKRKKQLLEEMLNGNFLRECDLDYLKTFSESLKNDASAIEISEEHNVPLPTVKMVLRNLFSGNLLKRIKQGKYYVYSLASA